MERRRRCGKKPGQRFVAIIIISIIITHAYRETV
jgi:hypothetical protein